MLMLAGILVLALQAHAILIVVMSKLAIQGQIFIQLRSNLHAAIETKGSDRMPSEHLMQPVIPSIFIAIGAVPARIDSLLRMHMLAGILMPAIQAYAVFIIVMRPRTIRSLLLMLLTIKLHAAILAMPVSIIVSNQNMVSVVNGFVSGTSIRPPPALIGIRMLAGVFMATQRTHAEFIIRMAFRVGIKFFSLPEHLPTIIAFRIPVDHAFDHMLPIAARIRYREIVPVFPIPALFHAGMLASVHMMTITAYAVFIIIVLISRAGTLRFNSGDFNSAIVAKRSCHM